VEAILDVAKIFRSYQLECTQTANPLTTNLHHFTINAGAFEKYLWTSLVQLEFAEMDTQGEGKKATPAGLSVATLSTTTTQSSSASLAPRLGSVRWDFEEEYKNYLERGKLFDNVLAKRTEKETSTTTLRQKQAEIENLSKELPALEEKLTEMEMEEKRQDGSYKDKTREITEWLSSMEEYSVPGLIYLFDILDPRNAHGHTGESEECIKHQQPQTSTSSENQNEAGSSISKTELELEGESMNLDTQVLNELQLVNYSKEQVKTFETSLEISRRGTVVIQSRIDWCQAGAQVEHQTLYLLQKKAKLDNTKKDVDIIQNDIAALTKQCEDASYELQKECAKHKPTEETKWEMFMPLTMAGAYIRAQRAEWQKNDSQYMAMVEQGHKASCCEMALTDALIFEESSLVKRSDTDAFFQMYGVLPNYVIEHKHCSRLMDVLDWYCAVKDIMECAYNTNVLSWSSFEKSAFGGNLKALFRREAQQMPQGIDGFLEKTDDGKQFYEILKKEHDRILATHKVHLESKKRR
jgi:hypothetical protein